MLRDLSVSPGHPLADTSEPFGDLASALSSRSQRIALDLKLPLDHVRRSNVIDRLMQRLMTDHDREWILQGGTALASRRAVLGYPARKMLDLDASTGAGGIDDILTAPDGSRAGVADRGRRARLNGDAVPDGAPRGRLTHGRSR